MTILQFLIAIMIGIPCLTILIVCIIKRREIESFFFPQRYNEIEMLELDNHTSTWLQKKNKNLTFEFNGGLYNTYFSDVEYKKDQKGLLIPVLKKNPSLYRSGRLSKFFYVEGNENPMDFRQQTITGNPQINMQISKASLSDIIMTEPSMMEQLFRNYGIFILGGMFILIIVIIFALRGDPTPAQAVAQV